ncbi:MAG: hypothetical protein IJV68_04210, partial [Clostridia bacterium]|nr:hypothetical protein [Clostridia bacterium]
MAEFHISTAFSFLSESRKLQLVNILNSTGELVAYFPGDEEVYMKAADMEDGRLFCALINIGLDPIEKLEICIDFDPKSIHALTPNGEEKSVFFVKKNDRYILDISANTL